MEIITDSYDNISVNQLYSKLNAKIAQLDKLEKEEFVNTSKSDYIEASATPKNYDEQDFQRVLEKFKKTDAQIRSHEQVHATIGHTTSPISYTYQQGPDGKMYAVGGSVRLDVSIPDDPKAASFKLDQIARAASGPSNPSGADIAIATQANMNKMLIEGQGVDDANK